MDSVFKQSDFKGAVRSQLSTSSDVLSRVANNWRWEKVGSKLDTLDHKFDSDQS